MSVIPFLKFGIFFLPLCRCFFVEIGLTDRNESKSIKLICGPPTENKNLKGNHTVLWHGSQFGSDEQQKLAETMQTDALVPNISISSSKRHRCYLLAAADAYKRLAPQKKRISRENSPASVPTENGICPPGHRIDQDRCFPCFPGSYTSGQDSVCYLCPKDFYMDKKAADSCWPCPEGRKTLAQGADSEEACAYFDESGHPSWVQNPPWAAIFALTSIIIIFVWVIIIILLVRYWKSKGDSDQAEVVERETDGRSSKPLLASGSGDKVGDSASQYSDSEDHIYAEIGDFEPEEDTYEVPRKPSEPPVYVDITPEVPEKRRRKTSSELKRESAEDHLYELPLEKSSEHFYEVPISNRSDSHSYEVPIRRSSGRGEREAENIYDDVPSGSKEGKMVVDMPKQYSTGFEPSSSAKRAVPNISRSRDWRQSRQSDLSQQENLKSDEKRSFVSQDNIYDVPPEEGEYDMPPEEGEYDMPPEEGEYDMPPDDSLSEEP